MDYYANFRPFEDEDGHFRTPMLTIADKVDTNKRKLKEHVLAYCSGYDFPSYPVVLDIWNETRDGGGGVVESWKQDEPGGKWKRMK